MSKRVLTSLVLTAATVAVVTADVRFTSMFKAMDAGTVSFAGKKVAALVISQDDSLRVAGEENLAQELSARGLQGVATYRMAPKEELQKAETARPWFERNGVEGVVAIRPVSAGTRTTYTEGTWVSPYYSSFWGYYGYGWGSVYVPGTTERERVVVVETTIYSIPRNELLWAAVTETSNPKNLGKFVQELVKASVKQLHEQGLAKATPK